MRRLSALPACTLSALAILTPASKVDGGLSLAPEGPFSAAARSYVQNRGQWDAQAQYLAQVPGANLWITDSGAVFDFHRTSAPKGPTPGTQNSRRGHVVRMEFVGAVTGDVSASGKQDAVHNYFLGNDPDRWVSSVPLFDEVSVRRLYDGIDARWYFEKGAPRYDIIVAPGKDPSRIAMKFDGADGLRSTSDGLEIQTSLGAVRHQKLFAYQSVDGKRSQVACSIRTQGKFARFELGRYDRSKTLTIDPLIGGTYLGGTSADLAHDVASDSQGNAIAVGYTQSSVFPTTLGAYDQTVQGGEGYVAKFNGDMSALMWSTFLGGAGTELVDSLAMTSTDGVILAGYTNSADFPLVNAADSVRAGDEAFVARLSADGTSLVFSTYWGGSLAERAEGVAVDSLNRVVIAGYTESTDLFTTPGAYDTSHNGHIDLFVTKFSAGGVVLFSTYVGGTWQDNAVDLALDSTGKPVVTGFTYSADFPTTAGAFDTTHSGQSDVFVLKLSGDGSSVRWGTFLGAESDENAWAIASGPSDSVGVVGVTRSAGFPTTAGTFGTAPSGFYDGFATKFNKDGKLLFSSVFGGDEIDEARGCAFDQSGRLCVVGHSNSTNFPTTSNSFLRTPLGGLDAYIVQFSPSGAGLRYSSLLGSPGDDTAQAIVISPSGNAIVAGWADTDLLLPPGAWDGEAASNTDVFVAKFSIASPTASVSPAIVVSGVESVVLKLTLPAPAGVGGVSVQMATSTSYVAAPASIFVHEGATVKSTTLKTFAVPAERFAMIRARRPGGPYEWVSVLLKPGGLGRFFVYRDTTRGGFPTTGTVVLTAPAPPGGRVVKLTSSTTKATVPSSVTVLEGQTEATFPITTKPVPSIVTAALTAKLGNDTLNFAVTIIP